MPEKIKVIVLLHTAIEYLTIENELLESTGSRICFSGVCFDSKSENPNRIGIQIRKSESARNQKKKVRVGSESKRHSRDSPVVENGLNCGRCGYIWMPAMVLPTPRQPYRTIQGNFSLCVYQFRAGRNIYSDIGLEWNRRKLL